MFTVALHVTFTKCHKQNQRQRYTFFLVISRKKSNEFPEIFSTFAASKIKTIMEKKSTKEIVATVFKALTLAMGAAVVALSILGIEGVNMPLMLGLGLTCAGISLLNK